MAATIWLVFVLAKIAGYVIPIDMVVQECNPLIKSGACYSKQE